MTLKHQVLERLCLTTQRNVKGLQKKAVSLFFKKNPLVTSQDNVKAIKRHTSEIDLPHFSVQAFGGFSRKILLVAGLLSDQNISSKARQTRSFSAMLNKASGINAATKSTQINLVTRYKNFCCVSGSSRTSTLLTGDCIQTCPCLTISAKVTTIRLVAGCLLRRMALPNLDLLQPRGEPPKKRFHRPHVREDRPEQLRRRQNLDNCCSESAADILCFRKQWMLVSEIILKELLCFTAFYVLKMQYLHQKNTLRIIQKELAFKW